MYRDLCNLAGDLHICFFNYFSISFSQECTRLGFDTVEFNMGSLGFPEETLLRFVRLIKNAGLKAKPQFSVMFEKSDIPETGNRAYGSYVVPTPQTSGMETISSYLFNSGLVLEWRSFNMIVR